MTYYFMQLAFVLFYPLLAIFSALSLLVATKRYILSKTTFCYHVSDRPALDFLFNFIDLKPTTRTLTHLLQQSFV